MSISLPTAATCKVNYCQNGQNYSRVMKTPETVQKLLVALKDRSVGMGQIRSVIAFNPAVKPA